MEIKIRYTFKRKSDGHIWQEIVPIECLEGKGNKPFVLKYPKYDWELIARDLWIGEQDENGTDIFDGDIVDVCIFLVSPANPDNDQHFRGVVTFDSGKFNFQIYQYKDYSNGKCELVALKPSHLPFYEPDLDEDGTFTVPLFDFIGISGNLGEFNSELIEVIGIIYLTPELLTQ